MFNYILKNYFDKPIIGLPLAISVITPGDFHLFLLETRKNERYVIVEADHLALNDFTLHEVENAFPVHVLGWCTSVNYQKRGGEQLLRSFELEAIRNQEREFNSNYIVYRDPETRMRYALLKVTSEEGI